MSIEPGKYHVFSAAEPFRLAAYEGNTVRVNDSSNAVVEIWHTVGGYQMRFSHPAGDSALFSADDNLTDDSKVLLKDNDKYVWSITSAGEGFHKISIYNKDVVWYLSDKPQNEESVSLGKSQGRKTELWRFDKA